MLILVSFVFVGKPFLLLFRWFPDFEVFRGHVLTLSQDREQLGSLVLVVLLHFPARSSLHYSYRCYIYSKVEILLTLYGSLNCVTNVSNAAHFDTIRLHFSVWAHRVLFLN